MLNIIRLGILLLPWIVYPVLGIDQTRLPKEIFFNLICFAIITCSLIKGTKLFYFNRILGIICGWIFITIFLNLYLPFFVAIERKEMGINLWTLFPTINVILSIWVIYILAGSLESKDYKEIAKTICLSSVLVSIFAILQVVGLDPMGGISKYNLGNHCSALLDNPNLVGNYLCISIPLFLYFIKDRKYQIGLLLTIICLILSKSSISLIATLIVIIIYLFTTNIKKIYSIILSILSLAGVIFIFPSILSGTLGLRMFAWSKALVHIKDNPLFGQGLGIFKMWQIKCNNSFWTTAHNDWLERTCELGILGLVLIIFLVVRSFLKFNYKNKDKLGFTYLLSFIAFLLLMCGSFPMEVAPLVFTGLITFCAVETF